MLKPTPPCAEASASCTPNQTIMVVNSAKKMWKPRALMEGLPVLVRLVIP